MAHTTDETIEVSSSKFDLKHTEEQHAEVEDDALLSGKDARIKVIKRKTDLRICGLLGLLYTMAAIDRVNLGVCQPNAQFALQ